MRSIGQRLLAVVLLVTSLTKSGPLAAQSRPATASELYDFLVRPAPRFGGAQDFFTEAFGNSGRLRELNDTIAHSPELKELAEQGLNFRREFQEAMDQDLSPSAQRFIVNPIRAAVTMLERTPPTIRQRTVEPLKHWEVESMSLADTVERFHLPPSTTVNQISAARARDVQGFNAFQFFQRRMFVYEAQTRTRETAVGVDVKLWRSVLLNSIREARLENLNSLMSRSLARFPGRDVSLKLKIAGQDRPVKVPLRNLLAAGKRIVPQEDIDKAGVPVAEVRVGILRRAENAGAGALSILPHGVGLIGVLLMDPEGIWAGRYMEEKPVGIGWDYLQIRAEDLGLPGGGEIAIKQSDMTWLALFLQEHEYRKLSAGRSSESYFMLEGLRRENDLVTLQSRISHLGAATPEAARQQLSDIEAGLGVKQTLTSELGAETRAGSEAGLVHGLKWWGYQIHPTHWLVRDNVAVNLNRSLFQDKDLEGARSPRTFGLREGYHYLAGTIRNAKAWKQMAAGAVASILVGVTGTTVFQGSFHAAGKGWSMAFPDNPNRSSGHDDVIDSQDARAQIIPIPKAEALFWIHDHGRVETGALFHYPGPRDHIEDRWTEIPVNNRTGFLEGQSYSVRSRLPVIPVGKNLMLPSPLGYKVTSLRVFAIHPNDSETEVTDVRAERAEQRPLFRAVLGEFKTPWQIKGYHVRYNLLFEGRKASPLMPALKPEILISLSADLREAGFKTLSQRIDEQAGIAKAGGAPVTFPKLEATFKQNLYYPKVSLPYTQTVKITPGNRFAEFSDFALFGEGFMQCTGSNLIYARFIDEYLFKDPKPLKPLNLLSFNSNDYSITSLGHLTTLLTSTVSPGSYIHLDATPFKEAAPVVLSHLRDLTNKPAVPKGLPVVPPSALSAPVYVEAKPRPKKNKDRDIDTVKDFVRRAHALIEEKFEGKRAGKDVMDALLISKALRVANAWLEWKNGKMDESDFRARLAVIYPGRNLTASVNYQEYFRAILRDNESYLQRARDLIGRPGNERFALVTDAAMNDLAGGLFRTVTYHDYSPEVCEEILETQ